MLQPVVWGRDLAAGYREARAKKQLVLVLATPSADT